uniref:Secreted protein n=1 Tax=Microcebus murinus TaxID=30608 RepID=A0A8C5V9C9_MICMU
MHRGLVFTFAMILLPSHLLHPPAPIHSFRLALIGNPFLLIPMFGTCSPTLRVAVTHSCGICGAWVGCQVCNRKSTCICC